MFEVKLDSLYLKRAATYTGPSPELSPSLRAQLFVTAKTLMVALLDSGSFEDSLDEVEPVAFTTVGAFREAHLFHAQTGFIFLQDDGEPPAYRVSLFGSDDDDDFLLVGISVPYDGNPMGYYFLGTSTEICGDCGEYWSLNRYPEKLPPRTHLVAMSLRNDGLVPAGTSFRRAIRGDPSGAVRARLQATFPEIVAGVG